MKLLSYDGYSPAMRDLYPSNFLRAELLKAVKYPEISYRKFCGDDNDYEGHKEHSPYIGMDNKQNRAFIGLPLNRKKMFSHVQMCQFRAGLTFSQLVNLMVYILYGSEVVSKALDIRKNGERPFNLLKKCEGLEQVRVRSQHGIVARSTFTTMATLLLELAGTRRTKKAKQKQRKLPLAA